MTKLKLIKKITSDWFESHAFVNEVYWGDFIRWYADKEIQHSCVVITPVRVTEVTRSKRAIQLQITYADRVFGDFRNLDDVHSDADRVLADFILSASNDKEVRKYLTGLTSGNIEYFTNRTGDLVAGATMSVSLNVFSDANSCEIPVDFKPQPTPFECEDVVVVVNSTTLGTVASGDTLDVSTVDTDGNPIVTNNTLTGNNLEIEAPDSNYTVQYVNGTLIESGTIPSGGSVTVNVPNIPTCDSATWELRDSNNVLLDSGSIASGGSATIVAPDATVNVQKSNGVLISAVTTPSGGVEPYNVADSVITVNGDAYTDLKATDDLDVPIEDSLGNTLHTTVVSGVVQVFLYWYMVAVLAFRQRLINEGATFETDEALTNNLIELGETEYNDASLVITPNGYDVGVLYAVKPNDGTADFDYIQNTANGTRINEDGLIEVLPANTPRITWENGEPLILIEEENENIVPYSQDLTNSSYVKSNCTITANTSISPDGTTTTDTINQNTGTIGTLISAPIIPNDNKVRTVSCFIKKETVDAYAVILFRYQGSTALLGTSLQFNKKTGDFVTGLSGLGAGFSSSPLDSGVVSVGDYWLVYLTLANNLSGNNQVYFGCKPNRGTALNNLTQVNGSAEAWGFSLTEGYINSYIPTNGSTETRNDDVYSVTPPAGTTEIKEYLSNGTINTITTIPSTYTPAVGKYKKIVMS